MTEERLKLQNDCIVVKLQILQHEQQEGEVMAIQFTQEEKDLAEVQVALALIDEDRIDLE